MESVSGGRFDVTFSGDIRLIFFIFNFSFFIFNQCLFGGIDDDGPGVAVYDDQVFTLYLRRRVFQSNRGWNFKRAGNDEGV